MMVLPVNTKEMHGESLVKDLTEHLGPKSAFLDE